MARIYEDTSSMQCVREFRAPIETIRAHLPPVIQRNGSYVAGAVPCYVLNGEGDAFDYERTVRTAARSCRGIYAALLRARKD